MLYGFNYCYKSVAMPAEGVVIVGDKEHQLSKNALALLDWSTGTPPRETIWNWCSAAGRDAKGRTLGVNFGCGLNEYSFHENTIWLDGQPHMLDGVDFAYDPKDVLGKPWRLTTADGGADLTFHPDNERYEFVYFGVVASRLHQPFGRLEGKLRFGKETVNAELYGFCEEHYAKW
jgi:hypothetical protein